MVGKAISLTALGTGSVSKISLLLTFAIAVTLLDALIYMLKNPYCAYLFAWKQY